MGLMEQLPLDGRLVVTPHPVLLDGQRNVPADLRPGESLYAFLTRHVEGLDGERWVVAIGGREVPRHLWHHVYPKHGQVIEARGGVGKSAVALIAMAALTYFTLGAGGIAGGAFLGLTGAVGYGAATAAFVTGSVLINKVLAPRATSSSSTSTDSVYAISDATNASRAYEPLPLLLGPRKVTPDRASNPYTWYEGDDQYLGLILTPGLNVYSVDELYVGDALLSDYEGVTVWYSGFAGMAEQSIPLLTNVDTIDGGSLDYDDGETIQWVQRTSSEGTIQLRLDVEYLIYDVSSKGKYQNWNETIYAEYRAVGSDTWLPFFGSTNQTVLSSSKTSARRKTFTLDVAAGQFQTRMRRNTTGDGTGDRSKVAVTWSTLGSVQPDTADYAGIPRIGIKIKATGQLNGTPDTITCIAHSTPTEVWDGSSWVVQETSNPGAHLLRYARGVFAGTLQLAGIGLSDEMIDIEALKGFTLHCAANGFTYNNCFTDARTHEDVCNAIALCGMGQITWAGGKFSVVWCADDQPLSGVVNMATITNASFQVDYTLANSADGIEYSYYDAAAGETKTLRVVIPTADYDYPLNPSQVEGEGVTTEAHAAVMARYHLAQSLYQYKSIGYGTDLEHLSYRRLSLLALQHDLTQWGYGGRIKSASVSGNRVILELDEEVPAPPSGNAYIGLRIPGEAVYRVFAIQSFTGTSTHVALTGTWPDDAPLPGASADNPAHDTIWIYDFKQTPGYRVRVVSVQPENDLAGATVAVVPESDEFWTYVLTGQYIPPANQSLLQTRPIASNLKVTEQQVVQGNTVYTELTATFDISGMAAESVVFSDLDGNGELERVASTSTRTATWRIPGAGTYAVVVRPYNEDGLPGVAASLNYTTIDADAPPVNVDSFTIEELSGGVRRYSWGFDAATTQSPDFVGVQIRYIGGSVANPNWTDMTPLGSEGYHAIAFESTLPVAGSWTFAIRAVNSSGSLSSTMRTVQKALSNNLGEQLVTVVQQLSQTEQDLTEMVEQVDQYSESVIQQAINISAVNDKTVQNRAYISELQETSVTEESAAALVQEQVGAATAGMTATVQQVSEAMTDLEGNLSATYNVKVQTTADGKAYLAGIGLGVYTSDGITQSEIALLADRLVFMSSAAGGGYYYPFEIVDGVVFANAAMIRDGTINYAKISEELKTSNYVWDGASGTYTGWRLSKDGDAQFGGDVEIRGTVYGNKIVGQFQAQTLVTWEGSVSGGVSTKTTLTTVTLPTPMNPGESHTPVANLSVTCNPTGDSSGESWFIIDASEDGGSTWTEEERWSIATGSSIRITHGLTFVLTARSVETMYRISLLNKNNGSYITVQQVNGLIYGLR